MIATANPVNHAHGRRRFFTASVCASLLVFAALTVMLTSMNAAYRPLPAEHLVQAGADTTEPVVVGMAGRWQ